MIGLNLFVNGYTIPLNVLSYCAGYRIRVHLFIFNAVSSLLKYMQFALQCNRSIYALYENDTNGSEDKVVRTASIWNSTTFWQ